MAQIGQDSFAVRRRLEVGNHSYSFYSLKAAEAVGIGAVSRLPVSLKILLENLLRHEDGEAVDQGQIRLVGSWAERRAAGGDVSFHPVRVLMPDVSGIPLLADLAAMRDAAAALDGEPGRINPMIPLDFVIDHSVMVDSAGSSTALQANLDREFARNGERFAFVRWAERSLANLNVIPPGNGICHQVNLERLARVVAAVGENGEAIACPDTLVGMDSHTPMVNALGVFGWGVGGIEAASAMLGQPIALAVPEAIGCRLTGRPRPGVTTTDIVLTLCERLRARRVVAAFVEFCGPGIAHLALPDRATLSNMAAEYGATMALFPIDAETIRYLTETGRDPQAVRLVEAYAREQGLWWDAAAPEPVFTDIVEFDLGAVEPCAAGPRRPQDRVPLVRIQANFRDALSQWRPSAGPAAADGPMKDGDVAIAAITSCTNTSNPSVMIGAGLLAQKAVARGLAKKPWVKTSLSPGSRAVSEYLRKAGLQEALDALGFQTVGYGCMTCMGNSGPLAPEIAETIETNRVATAAVLSGNRNFESRIHPLAKANYLMAPALVVAYAIAGSVLTDIEHDPLGIDPSGQPVYLRDVWPADAEIRETVARAVSRELFEGCYGSGFAGSEAWERIPAGGSDRFGWDPASTYIKKPPYFEGMRHTPETLSDIFGARPLAVLGDSVTTDHISPIGAIPADGPAGRYLIANGVAPADFNSFGARRSNHEVMIRGAFANLSLRNEMAPSTIGGLTRHMPDGAQMPIFDAAMRYAEEEVPLVVVAGAEYGTGSSRDWAAKGPALLGVRAIIAEGFERIHRSNLVGMGVLPFEFVEGANRKTLGLDGSERFDITGIAAGLRPRMDVACTITRADGTHETISLLLRIDTAREAAWVANGGILRYVLRARLAA